MVGLRILDLSFSNQVFLIYVSNFREKAIFCDLEETNQKSRVLFACSGILLKSKYPSFLLPIKPPQPLEPTSSSKKPTQNHDENHDQISS